MGGDQSTVFPPDASFLLPLPPFHFGTHTSLIPQKVSPFFSCTYKMQISHPLCFDIHTKCPGWVPPFSLSIPCPPIPYLFGNFISSTLVPISKNRRRAGQEASSHVRP